VLGSWWQAGVEMLLGWGWIAVFEVTLDKGQTAV